MCKRKKSGAPKVLLTTVDDDGVPIRANMVVMQELNSLSVEKPTEFSPDGRIVEKFYADTGATHSLHPNIRAAASYYRLGLKIGTAADGKGMVSDGVGKMLLYTPGGDSMPGFDKVIFAKGASEKLASVGDLCDAGFVCVFDKHGLKTYKESNIKIEGKYFTSDERDKKNRLFPLSLYRNAKEKNNSSIIAALSVLDSVALVPSLSFPQSKEETNKMEELPKFVADGLTLPTTMLAKTYIKDGLSVLDRYHAKFGDVGIKYIKRAMPTLKIPSHYRCEFCIEGKIHKFGHKACPPGTRTEYLPGVCIHTDHSGPYAKSLGGARYSQLFMDRGSGYLWGVRMAKKTGHYTETPKILLDASAISGRRVQFFHTDGDGVFSGKENADLLAGEKVRHEKSAPYDSNTNAFIERARRTIFEGVCTALLRAGAPARFWGEAEQHKIFTINVLPTVPDPESKEIFISRRNLLEGNRRPFNLDHLMAFGTAVTCYVPMERRQGGKQPAQRRSFKGAILGYVENMPAYRIWDFDANEIRSVSYNFTICHEGYYPFRDKKNWPPEFILDPVSFSPTIEGVLTSTEWKKFCFDEEDAEEVLSDSPQLVVSAPDEEKKLLPPVDAEPPIVVPLPSLREEEPEEKKPESNLKNFWRNAMTNGGGVQPPSAPLPDPPILRRSARLANFSQVEEHIENVPLDPFDKPISIPPPKTFREAKLSPWWPEYLKASQAEYDGHIENKTWVLVPRSSVPPDKNILRGKWVLDDKRGEDGKILRFKARFVAMGFTQKEGVDFKETFAGVMVAKSFRTMLIILNEDPTFEMEHWDVRMAFTQAYLEEELYMYQPEGFEKDAASVCRLLKSLYGLKQSARNWQNLLVQMFNEANFFPLMADPCVFFLKEGDGWCMCSTHVDDIFCLFNQPGKHLRDRLFKKISTYVQMENLGPVSWALQTTILRDRVAGVIKISQERYTQEFLNRGEFLKNGSVEARAGHDGQMIHSRKTPNFFATGKEKTLDDSYDRVNENLKNGFQVDIGALWWLAQISRPDIYFSVHRCAKMVHQPTKKLGLFIKSIKDYLAETATIGITFQRKTTPLNLSGFVDAAFASEEGALSRTGYFFLFRENLVSWASENPKRIMTSSTEVECRGLVQISKENSWHRQFHAELNIYPPLEPTVIHEDNTASITMSTDKGSPHKRSKHFGIEWAYFKQAVDYFEIKPVYLSTDEQPADMLTKALPPPKFIYFRDMIMGAGKIQSHFDKKISTTHIIVDTSVKAKQAQRI